jgi:hypothetical protein
VRNECAVFGQDPNERSEPPPLTVFDLAHGVVWFTCDCRHVFGAIRTGGEELCRIRSGAQKWDIVEAVAHLSIVMMESYALKELSEAEMLRVEKHVASCPKCRDHLEGRTRMGGGGAISIQEARRKTHRG